MEIDLDLSGVEALRAELEEIETTVGRESVWRVTVSADYAKYLETGTRDMPAYPFFRPAIREFQARGNAFLRKHGFDIEEADSAADAVSMVALSLEAQMKQNVTAQAAGGRSPGTHPEHPKVQTGNLRSSISARRVR